MGDHVDNFSKLLFIQILHEWNRGAQLVISISIYYYEILDLTDILALPPAQLKTW